TEPGRKAEFNITERLTVTGDSQLLRIVLNNLFENAWKFTAKVPATRIEFGSVRQRDGSNAYFVRDNGAGFEMQYADKLFGVFQRLHSGKEFTGTGIGLATVKRVITRHGGNVWAEGAVGHGAKIYFSL